MIRLLDLVFSGIGLIILSPIFLLLLVMGLLDTGSPLYWQTRIGKDRRYFKLVKFRSMRPGTASVATHLASSDAVTPFGRFLRRSKLDELPQLWNVLKGEMSLVGPRPCLVNQTELIAERAARGVFNARPGITGLSQVSGIDMSTPVLLAETDAKMLSSLTASDYFRYIFQTVVGQGAGDRIRS